VECKSREMREHFQLLLAISSDVSMSVAQFAILGCAKG